MSHPLIGPLCPLLVVFNVGHLNFSKANFGNLFDAVCALVVVLSSQFYTWNYSHSGAIRFTLDVGGPSEGFVEAIGAYFHVKFPDDFTSAEQYDFDWSALKTTSNPIQKLF
jgi:hypothetical protein